MKNNVKKILLPLLVVAQNHLFAAAGGNIVTNTNMCCTGYCTGVTNCTTVNAVGDARVYTEQDLYNVTFGYKYITDEQPQKIQLALPTASKKSGVNVTFAGLDAAHKNVKFLTTLEEVDGIFVYKFYRKFVNSSTYQEVGQLTAYEALPYLEFTAYSDGRIQWFNKQTGKIAEMNIGKEDLIGQVSPARR